MTEEKLHNKQDAIVFIDDVEKLISIYGKTTTEEITLLKKYKPKYSIAKFISGDMPFGSNIEGLIMQNI